MPKIAYEDHKAAPFYAKLQQRLGFAGDHAAAFTFMVSQINFVHHWLRVLFAQPDDYLFRVRYLTVYHGIAGLNRLGAAVSGNRGTLIGSLAAELLNTHEAKTLRKIKPRLRHAMAHYKLKDNINTSQISAQTPAQDIIRHLSARSVAEIDNLLDRQLDAMSVAFRRVLTPGKAAKPLE